MNEKEKIYGIIKNIVELLEFEIEIEISEERCESLVFVINSQEHSQFLIGHHGANLFALEYIVHNIARTKGIDTKFTIDVNEYKKGREAVLINNALDTAQEVLKNKRPIVLRPMNAYERRLIHTALQEKEGITTESIGERAQRKVVIKPVSEIN